MKWLFLGGGCLFSHPDNNSVQGCAALAMKAKRRPTAAKAKL